MKKKLTSRLSDPVQVGTIAKLLLKQIKENAKQKLENEKTI